jgi:hypothetical protein
MHHGPTTTRVPTSPALSVSGDATQHHAPACSNQGGTKLRTGRLSGLAGPTTITSLCSLLTGGPLPDLAGGTIKWSRRVASSTGVAFTGGTASVVTKTNGSFLQIIYTGGSVAGGSFTNASGASLTVTSRSDTTRLGASCAKRTIRSIAVSGSVTL